MRMLRTPPFFPPKSGEKPYLEVFSRFGLWRDFLNDNIQATIYAFRLTKNMSINPKSEATLVPRYTTFDLFFYHNIKDNERNLCQDLLTIENTDSDLKVHVLHYANELLVRVRLSSNFCKNAQHTETIQKHVWEKSNDACSLSIRVQTTINHISIFKFLCFFTTISSSKKMFSFRARAEKGTARHIDVSDIERRGWDLIIFDRFVSSICMQVILDSFARPGSGPIWGGKKGEFRDWTRGYVAIGAPPCSSLRSRHSTVMIMYIFSGDESQ